MNSNNQNDYSKEDQDGEKYSNFYQKLEITSQNQEKTEAEGGGPISHNPENNSSGTKNMPDKISEKELKKESNATSLQSSLPTEEAKQPDNEPKPIENEPVQQDIYDDLQNQVNQQNTTNLIPMEEEEEDEEEEELVASQKFGNNTNITEAYTELNQNQSEINQERRILDLFNESQNPNIYIPIQPWDKVSNMHSFFDNGYSDFYEDSDERLNFYGDYEDQFEVNNSKTKCSTEKKYG